jgi:peptidoglycan/xylan/chitin deacetylase (PgdA/CDA1 family)
MDKLSRFQRASVLAALGVLGFAALLPSPDRWWCAGGLAAVYLLISVTGVFAVRMNYYVEAVCRGNAGKKRIALTFDDGPDNRTTPLLLDILKAHQAHATFFCVGRQARESPELIKRIVAEGHTLGNHSYSHHWWTNFLTTKPLAREINRAQGALRDLSGVSPRYYRSPMGLSNPHLAAALRKTGLKLVAWDVRPFDRGSAAKTIVRRIAGTDRMAGPARDGSIVLLHDGGGVFENLAPAVAEIIERFQSRGYSFVNLDELLEAL